MQQFVLSQIQQEWQKILQQCDFMAIDLIWAPDQILQSEPSDHSILNSHNLPSFGQNLANPHSVTTDIFCEWP